MTVGVSLSITSWGSLRAVQSKMRIYPVFYSFMSTWYFFNCCFFLTISLCFAFLPSVLVFGPFSFLFLF
ncbi:hypothetical protein BDQ94DRAFT_139946 [Aspergillus welwitschiae]|uniref:Uncharacterized protein n=1 Tax=Aspergillus welwitschiae TaxID=1341132 RepID=A0A3F3Q8Q9_9EURO|nr:hypothetical protein BDQ94DRAFT_139946 [Aspergillus welwitschiae]RDH35624.1 hypothetical protein BDQ94DRAFT_139946 [Aspergillus welwitschiae]